MPNVGAELLTAHVAAIFEAAGTPATDARDVAQHLVDSNLAGHDSHGVIRTLQYLGYIDDGRIQPGAEAVTERESGATALIRGRWNFGQLVARDAMSHAIRLARDVGVGAVVADELVHSGRMGTFGEQAAAARMLGIALVQGRGRVVAPFGGAVARLSTNPICIAAPTADPAAPFVLDMATSVVAGGKVRVANASETQLPADWAIDADGRPTRDPDVLHGERPGALLPLGGAVGYKGFGLSLAVCALAGALAPHDQITDRRGSSVLMIAIDIGRFRDPDDYGATFGDLLSWLKETPRQPGVEEIFTAGEVERRSRAERQRDGVPLDDGTWAQLAEAAAKVGVAPLEA